jgi:hypothetical protein
MPTALRKSQGDVGQTYSRSFTFYYKPEYLKGPNVLQYGVIADASITERCPNKCITHRWQKISCRSI